MYKCNEQRDISSFNKLDIWKNRGKKYTIRKKGVIEVTKKELEWLIKEGAMELMKEQDQSRKFCPCCSVSLE